MTPQEFVATLEPAETYRRVAIIHALPLYSVSQWLAAVRQHAASKFDRWAFHINPMRLHAYIDGIDVPRAITCYDERDQHAELPPGKSDEHLTIIRDIVL